MATDLAKLVARLELQSSQFQSELVKANKKLAKFDSDVGRLGKRIKAGFAGLLSGIAVGATISKIITETRDAEAAQAKLANAIERNAGAANASLPEFSELATRLQRLTTFSDEAVMEMQSLLLRFRQIGGEENRRAQVAILDLATAMGMDLSSATKLVGRALADPLKGMNQLARAGVALTADQKNLIKGLAESGQAAQAQGVLLRELEARYGGAAVAARQTFGGALQGLANDFSDLLEGKGGLPDAVDAINELSGVLQDPQTVAAANTLTSALFRGFSAVTQAISGTINVARFLGEEFAALRAGAAADDVARLEEQLALVQRLLQGGALGRVRFFGKDGLVKFYDKAELEQEAKRLKELIASASSPAAALFTGGGTAAGGTADEDVVTLTGALEEFDVVAKRIKSDPLAQYFEQLNNSTKTAAEQTVDQINEVTAALQALQREGIISADVAETRRQAALEELLPAFDIAEIQKKRIIVQAEVDKLNEYQIQAARNTQDILATTIGDAFRGEFDDIGKKFQDMILDLIAQAQAARLAKYLFGDAGSGGSGTGGALTAVLGAFFGGARAMGGPAYAGQAHLVGERGPELYVPRTSGRIEPNRTLGGSTTVNVTVQAPTGSISRPTMLEVGATAARAMSRASRRNN